MNVSVLNIYNSGYFIFNDVLKNNSATGAAIVGSKADSTDEKKG